MNMGHNRHTGVAGGGNMGGGGGSQGNWQGTGGMGSPGNSNMGTSATQGQAQTLSWELYFASLFIVGLFFGIYQVYLKYFWYTPDNDDQYFLGSNLENKPVRLVKKGVVGMSSKYKVFEFDFEQIDEHLGAAGQKIQIVMADRNGNAYRIQNNQLFTVSGQTPHIAKTAVDLRLADPGK